MSYIIDSLIHPNDPSEFDETFTHITLAEPLDLKELNTYLYSTRNVALHILLSSVSRGFLSAVCDQLQRLDYTARVHLQQDSEALAAARGGDGNRNPPARQLSSSSRAAYETIAHLTHNSPVPYSQVLGFVIKIAGHCKEAYGKAGLSGTKDKNIVMQRNAIEQQILFGRELPKESAYAISRLFREDLPALKAEIDPAKLFFHDFTVLNVPLQDRGTNLPYAYVEAEDPAAKEKLRQKYVKYRVKHTVDVFQRKMVELGVEPEQEVERRKGRKWRRCVRCAAVMGDLATGRNVYVNGVVKVMMRCHCGGHWSVMTGKRVVP